VVLDQPARKELWCPDTNMGYQTGQLAWLQLVLPPFLFDNIVAKQFSKDLYIPAQEHFELSKPCPEFWTASQFSFDDGWDREFALQLVQTSKVAHTFALSRL
jgi:hypothetical protein